MKKYRQQKEDYDEVVNQIKANYRARVAAFTYAALLLTVYLFSVKSLIILQIIELIY